jgi:hypothetical protein
MAKIVEVFSQKWRYYLHHEPSISTATAQIHAQIHKSGGSEDGGDIFRLYLVNDAPEFLRR